MAEPADQSAPAEFWSGKITWFVEHHVTSADGFTDDSTLRESWTVPPGTHGTRVPTSQRVRANWTASHQRRSTGKTYSTAKDGTGHATVTLSISDSPRKIYDIAFVCVPPDNFPVPLYDVNVTQTSHSPDYNSGTSIEKWHMSNPNVRDVMDADRPNVLSGRKLVTNAANRSILSWHFTRKPGPEHAVFLHVYFTDAEMKQGKWGLTEFHASWVSSWGHDAAAGPFALRTVAAAREDHRTAIADFETSLRTPGAIVIYLGHSGYGHIGGPRTLKLAPRQVIFPNRLTDLLNRARASVVLLAACASNHAVTALTGDTAVIVTDSGPKEGTSTGFWTGAIDAFLGKLGSRATLTEALAAANEKMPRVGGKNIQSLALAHGKGSFRITD